MLPAAPLAVLAQTLIRVGLPTLASVLTTVLPPPFGALAGVVIPAIAQALGVEPTPEAVTAAVTKEAAEDPAALKAALAPVEAEQAAALENIKAQLQVYRDDFEGTSGAARVFYTGWRPALAWSLVVWVNVILLHVWLGGALTDQFLAIWNPAWLTLAGLLGLRTFEKFTGVTGGLAGAVVDTVVGAPRKKGP